MKTRHGTFLVFLSPEEKAVFIVTEAGPKAVIPFGTEGLFHLPDAEDKDQVLDLLLEEEKGGLVLGLGHLRIMVEDVFAKKWVRSAFHKGKKKILPLAEKED